MIPMGEGNPYAVRVIGHPRIERFVVDGYGLRRNLALMDAGVKLKARIGIAMGRDLDSETANGPCCRTSWAMRTTWATWTSR